MKICKSYLTALFHFLVSSCCTQPDRVYSRGFTSVRYVLSTKHCPLIFFTASGFLEDHQKKESKGGRSTCAIIRDRAVRLLAEWRNATNARLGECITCILHQIIFTDDPSDGYEEWMGAELSAVVSYRNSVIEL